MNRTAEGWIIAEAIMPPGWVDPVRAYEDRARARWKEAMIHDPLVDAASLPVLAPYTLWHKRTNEIVRAARVWMMAEARRQGAALTAWDGLGGLMGAVPFVTASIPDDSSRLYHALVMWRLAARLDRDWPEADRLKAILTDYGVETAEGRDGSATWTRQI